MLTECKTLITEMKFKAKVKYSSLRVTVIIAIDEQLNELAVIKAARVKTAI